MHFVLSGATLVITHFKNIKKKKVPADRTGPVRTRAMTTLALSRKRVFVLLSGVFSPLHCSHQEKTKKNRVDELARHTGDKARVHSESREGEQ